NSLFMIIVIGAISVFSRFRLKKNNLILLVAGSLVMLAPVLYVARLQSVVRGRELLETVSILNYADLGMANASLALTTSSGLSLGMESLFTPVPVILRGLGLDRIAFPAGAREWIWNPAANLLTYAISDFGYFGLGTYLIWGAVAGWIVYQRRIRPQSLKWNVAYLWLIYAIATIWTIPISRGPDFWCGVAFSLLAAWVLDRKHEALLVSARSFPALMRTYRRLNSRAVMPVNRDREAG
ncbi:MAG: hypothetical protein ACYDH0_05365, partial [Candidatus Aminicenantales bacterium]